MSLGTAPETVETKRIRLVPCAARLTTVSRCELPREARPDRGLRHASLGAQGKDTIPLNSVRETSAVEGTGHWSSGAWTRSVPRKLIKKNTVYWL